MMINMSDFVNALVYTVTYVYYEYILSYKLGLW